MERQGAHDLPNLENLPAAFVLRIPHALRAPGKSMSSPKFEKLGSSAKSSASGPPNSGEVPQDTSAMAPDGPGIIAPTPVSFGTYPESNIFGTVPQYASPYAMSAPDASKIVGTLGSYPNSISSPWSAFRRVPQSTYSSGFPAQTFQSSGFFAPTEPPLPGFLSLWKLQETKNTGPVGHIPSAPVDYMLSSQEAMAPAYEHPYQQEADWLGNYLEMEKEKSESQKSQVPPTSLTPFGGALWNTQAMQSDSPSQLEELDSQKGQVLPTPPGGALWNSQAMKPKGLNAMEPDRLQAHISPYWPQKTWQANLQENPDSQKAQAPPTLSRRSWKGILQKSRPPKAEFPRRPRKGGFSIEQTTALQEALAKSPYLTRSDKKELSERIGLTGNQIATWFQNKRYQMQNQSLGQATRPQIRLLKANYRGKNTKDERMRLSVMTGLTDMQISRRICNRRKQEKDSQGEEHP